MARSALGQSIILSSFLAILSYVRFEKIAKFTLIFCAITFINDPVPPTTRIVSMIGILVVLLLSKIEAKWREGQIDLDTLTAPATSMATSTLTSKRSGSGKKKD